MCLHCLCGSIIVCLKLVAILYSIEFLVVTTLTLNMLFHDEFLLSWPDFCLKLLSIKFDYRDMSYSCKKKMMHWKTRFLHLFNHNPPRKERSIRKSRIAWKRTHPPVAPHPQGPELTTCHTSSRTCKLCICVLAKWRRKLRHHTRLMAVIQSIVRGTPPTFCLAPHKAR